ncbi:MAG: NrtA/SsuA/CpmA family ABC transporter substrate-binding protein [Chloroflexi bacterium]|nr:NrtA/SsuA/CpmA family ABC transporter substrate-binding protein [Chloroflexota bacterium]MCL5074307.1 NrtA/SsuA/CpmA family ABC transporter substrate-binding protein [Chloroflexota bacterium]
MKRWFSLPIIIVVLLSFASSACTPAAAPTPTPTKVAVKPVELIIAETPSPAWAQIPIADAKELWAQEGIKVTKVTFTTGRAALEAVLGGKAHLATVAEIPIVFAAFQGQKIAIIADTERYTTWRAVARKDAGITTPKDLKGKKVGTSLGTNAQYFMHSFLKANGLTEADVQVVNVVPTDMVLALSARNIDAFFSWQPNFFKAKQALGDNYVEFIYPQYTGHSLLATTQDYAQQNPETIERILRVMLKADAFLKQNKKEAIELVVKGTKWDPVLVEAIWDEYQIKTELSQGLLNEWQRQAQWAIDAGLALKGAVVPNFKPFVYVDGLKKVDPAAVTIK